MLAPLLDALFPRRCLGCGRRAWPFCDACLLAIAVPSPPWCERCGRPLEVPVARCADCPPEDIAWARSAFLYEGPIRRALMGLKFGGIRSAAAALSSAMAAALDCGRVPGRPPLAVTWVPLGKRRKRARGYDQLELWDTKFAWTVPIDDTHFTAFDVTRTPLEGEAAEAYGAQRAREQESEAEVRWDLAEKILAGEMTIEEIPDEVSHYNGFIIEDYVTQVGQGPIRDQRKNGASRQIRLMSLRSRRRNLFRQQRLRVAHLGFPAELADRASTSLAARFQA